MTREEFNQAFAELMAEAFDSDLMHSVLLINTSHEGLNSMSNMVETDHAVRLALHWASHALARDHYKMETIKVPLRGGRGKGKSKPN